MSALSVGRIVTKVMGREAGRKAVITQLLDQNFAEITGPTELTGIKRRRVNIAHVEPTEYIIDISQDNNDDSTILSIIEKDSSLKDFMTQKLS